MPTFTVVLENTPLPTARQPVGSPVFHSTEVIEAEDLDHAWVLARAKWYVNQIQGTETQQLQIADIKTGEWTPPSAEALSLPANVSSE